MLWSYGVLVLVLDICWRFLGLPTVPSLRDTKRSKQHRSHVYIYDYDSSNGDVDSYSYTNTTPNTTPKLSVTTEIDSSSQNLQSDVDDKNISTFFNGDNYSSMSDVDSYTYTTPTLSVTTEIDSSSQQSDVDVKNISTFFNGDNNSSEFDLNMDLDDDVEEESNIMHDGPGSITTITSVINPRSGHQPP